MITHANVVAFLDWAIPHFGIGPDDRLSGHPPLHFDLSTFDIYGALTSGAQLHLVPPALNLPPRGIARFIDEQRLTQWFSVPSLLTYMAKFDAVPAGGFPTLRRVLSCGDVLPVPVLEHWAERLPHVTFTNLYGPTEATIASSFHTIGAPTAGEANAVPIGRACERRGAARPRRTAPAGRGRSRRRSLHRWRWPQPRLLARRGEDERRLSAGPAPRPGRRAHLPDGRSGAPGRGRARALPRTRRLAGQESRLPDRAR